MAKYLVAGSGLCIFVAVYLLLITTSWNEAICP